MIRHGTEVELAYLHDLFGKQLPLIYHSASAGSSQEKAELLGLPTSNVMNTLYFDTEHGLVGVVIPSSERIRFPSLAEPVNQIWRGEKPFSKSRARQLKLASELPVTQTMGTAGPWVPDSYIDSICRIVFHDVRPGIVNWAVPGRTDASIHLDYQDVFEKLSSMYPEKYVMAHIAK